MFPVVTVSANTERALAQREPRQWYDMRRDGPFDPPAMTQQRDAGLAALLRDLRAELGEFGYQWLAACAVYPGLHWNLTVYLGGELARANNVPRPDENAHLALARLPWFRKGSMPDELRLALTNELSPPNLSATQEGLKWLFHQAMKLPAGASEPVFEIDVTRAVPPGWRDVLRRLLVTAEPDAPVHDAIFVRYMMGRRPRATDLRLDRALVRLFGARFAGWLDLTTVVALFSGFAVAVTLWFGMGWLIHSYHPLPTFPESGADQEAGRPMIKGAPVRSLLTPVVEIIDPKDPAVVDRTEIQLRYSVRLPSPDDTLRVEVRVDGAKVAAEDGRLVDTGGTRAGILHLKIPRHDSNVSIIAYNANGASEPASVHLQWRGPGTDPEETLKNMATEEESLKSANYDEIKLRPLASTAHSPKVQSEARRRLVVIATEQKSYDAVKDHIDGLIKFVAKPCEACLVQGDALKQLNILKKAPAESRVGTALADKRVALIVGNSQYTRITPKLVNPANDAHDIAQALESIGFEVILKTDIGKGEFDHSLAEFARKAAGAAAAIFYYSGHGLQYQRQNYFLPVDIEVQDSADVEFQAVGMDRVLEAINYAAGVKIVILDASRDNPLARPFKTRGLGGGGATRGLAHIDRTEGLIIVYATTPDQVAQDGAGRNSPFTESLIKYIKEPGLEISTMFRRVANHVFERTNGRQRPEYSNSLLGDYYLNPIESDSIAWSRIRDSNELADFQEFIRKFPASTFAREAQARIDLFELIRRETEDAKRRAFESEKERQEQAAKKKPAEAPAASKKAATEAAAKTARVKATAEAARAKEAAENPAPEATPSLSTPEPAALVPDDIQKLVSHRGHALLIGVSDYKGGWDQLQSVKKDLQDLKAGLAPYFETVDPVPSPTAAELRARIREFLLGRWNKPEERLFIYYSGHGFTHLNSNSRESEGYITGSDTPLYNNTTVSAIENAIPFAEIDAINRQAKALHVLMVFDACFSGHSFHTLGPAKEARRHDFDGVRRMLHKPVRYYITACGQNERETADSTFATLLLHGLGGEADSFHEGIVSTDDLVTYLSREVSKNSKRRQTPQFRSVLYNSKPTMPPRMPQPLQTVEPSKPVNQLREKVEPVEAVVKGVLSALPVVVFLAWLGIRWSRRSLWLERRVSNEVPELDSIRLPRESRWLFTDAGFRSTAQNLRRHRRTTATDLDIKQTIEATVQRAGLFIPLYKDRLFTPEYLFLIEEVSADDHVARFGDEALDRLEEEGVVLDRVYFSCDPRLCFRNDEVRTPISLSELSARTAEHRLVVIGTADTFFHIASGRPERWLSALESWPTRVMLSPLPLRSWSTNELALLEHGFSLATASPKGFEALGDYICAVEEAAGGELLEGTLVTR